MKLVTVLGASALALVVGLVACSSDTTTPTPTSTGGTSSGGGVVGTGEGSSGTSGGSTDTTYPTANHGSSVGKVIENYSFLGYPDANVEGGLKTIKLEQYYDPTGKTTKLIHIQAAGVWCSACQDETTALVPAEQDLKDRKVIWLVAMVEGASPSIPSKAADMDGWIAKFSSPYTHILDPGETNLGAFFKQGALPYNINIDATTMTIVTSSAGGPPKTADILSDIDDALAMIGK